MTAALRVRSAMEPSADARSAHHRRHRRDHNLLSCRNLSPPTRSVRPRALLWGGRGSPGAFDVPNGRAYAVLALSSKSVLPREFDDPDRDRIQALALRMAPNAACVND